MSKTGFFIIGTVIGAIEVPNGDYKNYQLGIAVEGSPDQFGQAHDETIVVELSQAQFIEFGAILNTNINKPIKCPFRINNRFGVGKKSNQPYSFISYYLPKGSVFEILSPSSKQTAAA